MGSGASTQCEVGEIDMKTLRTLLMLLALLGLCGCTSDQLSGGPIDGVVLDQATQRPLAGAIVVAQWQGNTSGNWHDLGSWFVESHSLCYHVATAVSDGEGRFHIPAWESSRQEKGFHFNIGSHGRWLAVYAYKPGYDYDVSEDNRIIQLKPFKGTPRERMDNLSRAAGGMSCGLGGESEKSLRIFYRALYEEGKPLAETKKDFDLLSIWQAEAEGKPWW
jgi:hypothetical protein